MKICEMLETNLKWNLRSKIKECKGNLSKVAAILDISKRQLNNKILEYNLREWIQAFKK